MTIVCFVSGSGTNYRQIVARDPFHRYIVFTNRPGCGGAQIGRANGHPVIELSHVTFLREARAKYGPGGVPRNCPERAEYEQEICRLVEKQLDGGHPDLVCLAGYDQWVSDWMVERYYPRMLNVHPGDTTKGYDGLHRVPSAKAILAGDEALRSTLFIVDKGEDTGPVLVQSRPLPIKSALTEMERRGESRLLRDYASLKDFASQNDLRDYDSFIKKAGPQELDIMERICTALQEALKRAGDWEIYPFAVHDLIARGRVAVEGRTIYIGGKRLPEHGYRMDDA